MTPSLRQLRWTARCAAAGAALIMAAAVAPAVRGEEAAAPTAAPAIELWTPPEDPRDLLRVDDEMRQFFSARVAKHSSSVGTLRDIIDAILLPSGLNFAYDAEATYDARETFRRRRGNCVGFSFLFMAVARDFGLPAAFQTVDMPARWDRYGKYVVAVTHINVRVPIFDTLYVVDLRRDVLRSIDTRDLVEISDERAQSEFYSNVGFFRILHGRADEAMRFLVRATEIDPTSAGPWSNRAILLANEGRPAEAKACFERSLRLQPRGLVALDGYIAVLRELGTPEDLKKAAKLERRAAVVREDNPYFQEYLAGEAARRRDWATAEKRLRRALSLKNDEPAFYEQLCVVLDQLGRAEDAARMKVRLEKLRARLARESPFIVKD
ncbi:tetratricopeptide repeat protein [Opitutus sp. ER46]|uniref:tetratricopeptide repeat protein n=1 Tax=Opitutus sp. ER46 TaxID=2161864 RepID=UPI000D3176DE|nr:tetratricopeptide repeat protein [Opitutus sp. ER46]PTX94526.1 hypothetical protein DB354_12370 [Opitutus sp. ER46]